MPFSQRSRHQLSRHIVTLTRLNEANWQVTTEMDSLGFWTAGLEKVTVWLVPASWAAYGWHSGHTGNISIPSVSMAQLGDLWQGYHTRLTDILRHEWAHAVAHVHPGFIDCPRFARCFGGDYECSQPVALYDLTRHITPYAAAMPAEDFAEVFHHYLRHKGRLPMRLASKKHIARKWRFIERMGQRIAASKTCF